MSRRVKKLVERAEREGYVLYRAPIEHQRKLAEIQSRILGSLDDISCLDGFMVLLGMTAIVAVYGAHTKVDSLDILTREAFLKNCAERYDALAEHREHRLSTVNTEGGDA